jgi:putative methionine-R-sulfoxide reductase with GAF domain
LDAPPDGELAVLAATQYDGPTNSPSGSRSLAGYTVFARSVVIVDDVQRERRFDPCSLAEHSRSAIAAPVFGALGVRAVLMAESSTAGTFDRTAGDFLQALANVVGAALSGGDGT